MPALRARLICLLACLALTSGTSALEFECSVPGDTRYIRVELPGEKHLCEVTVEGDNYPLKTLWYANNDTLFCSAKAYELRDKYREQWNFDCATWPDRDGIDSLSEGQRHILDAQLKALIAEGKVADTPYDVIAVKAVSSALGVTPGVLGLQFFRAGTEGEALHDITQLLVESDGQWELLATQTGLVDVVSASDPDARIYTVLIAAITDAGALEVATQVASPTGSSTERCYGSQIVQFDDTGSLVAVTPHRYVCDNPGLQASE